MSLTTSTQTQEMSEQNAASPTGTSSDENLDGVLPLSYIIVTDEDDKRDALRLVADSIAQQRQVASAAIILNPLCLTVLVGLCAVAYRQYEHQGYGTLMTMLSGIIIMYLSTVRYFTSPYIQMAEAFQWKTWITGPDGKEDTIIAAIFGEELMATLVLRLEPQGKKGIIRAWTTRLRYRGKGVGSDLLQVAVRTTRDAFGTDALVECAPDHANSVNPMYDMFNGPFKKRQARAIQALAHALEAEAARRAK
ncbi:hypothetical protein PT974_03779 [Cladobotryum mycophilum]|uniref:N-acetyltransferase domain-containing protein n=1 Tax=Cladobotryum mycophilum TaxID=491253 RepID=A0ABR0SUF5_9HYPO